MRILLEIVEFRGGVVDGPMEGDFQVGPYGPYLKYGKRCARTRRHNVAAPVEKLFDAWHAAFRPCGLVDRFFFDPGWCGHGTGL